MHDPSPLPCPLDEAKMPTTPCTSVLRSHVVGQAATMVPTVFPYTAAIRPMLKDRVEVIEIVPPQVQTELSPGQSTDPNGMPLDAFADEVFALLYDGREPVEVCVQAVLPFRRAEAEGRFDEMLEVLARYS